MTVYKPHSCTPLSPEQIAAWANTVESAIGKVPRPSFTASMFVGEKSRLNGHHCACGTEDGTSNSPSLGEFELLPLRSEEVLSGMKAYMVCRKCGCFSHL